MKPKNKMIVATHHGLAVYYQKPFIKRKILYFLASQKAKNIIVQNIFFINNGVEVDLSLSSDDESKISLLKTKAINVLPEILTTYLQSQLEITVLQIRVII